MADFENYSMFEDGTCSYTSDEVEFNESPYDTDEDFNSEEQCSEYLSKNKGIQWYSEPITNSGRRSSANVLHEQPGVTRYAASRISDEISAFQLLLSKDIEEVIICNTNLEGQRIYAEKWNPVDIVELEAYLGLILLSGVSKSHNEATENLWN